VPQSHEVGLKKGPLISAWPQSSKLSRKTFQASGDELRELLTPNDADYRAIIDKGPGFLITSYGDSRQFRLTTLAAWLPALYGEPNHRQPRPRNNLIASISRVRNKHCLSLPSTGLLHASRHFQSASSVGVVEIMSRFPSGAIIAEQLLTAQQRDTGAGLDDGPQYRDTRRPLQTGQGG